MPSTRRTAHGDKGKTFAMSEHVARRTTGRVLVAVARREMGRAWVDALAAAGESEVAYHASVVQRRDEATRVLRSDWHIERLDVARRPGWTREMW